MIYSQRTDEPDCFDHLSHRAAAERATELYHKHLRDAAIERAKEVADAHTCMDLDNPEEGVRQSAIVHEWITEAFMAGFKFGEDN